MKTRKKREKTGQKWARYGLKCERVIFHCEVRWLNRVVQAAGSWSVDACCTVPGNFCQRYSDGSVWFCHDRTSSSGWLFGLGPGPPQRFEPTGTDNSYQFVAVDNWPRWGDYEDLTIGHDSNNDGCLALLTEILFIDLVPLKTEYQLTMGEMNGAVEVFVTGLDAPLSYTF